MEDRTSLTTPLPWAVSKSLAQIYTELQHEQRKKYKMQGVALQEFNSSLEILKKMQYLNFDAPETWWMELGAFLEVLFRLLTNFHSVEKRIVMNFKPRHQFRKLVAVIDELDMLLRISKDYRKIKHLPELDYQAPLKKVGTCCEKTYNEQESIGNVSSTRKLVEDYVQRQDELVLGRNEMIHQLEELLLHPEGPKIIALHGKRGVGKTHLVKTLITLPKIQNVFGGQNISWITVGRDMKLVDLQTELEKYISSMIERETLLVLDDIWKVDEVGFVEQKSAQPQCNRIKFLLTTRHPNITIAGPNIYGVPVHTLSGTESWELFRHHAFGRKGIPSSVEGVAKKVVAECRGLPLAVKVIARAISCKRIMSWDDALCQLRMHEKALDDDHYFHVLRVCYDALASTEKYFGKVRECFLWFAAFKEHEEIDVTVLMNCWIGEGLLKHNKSPIIQARNVLALFVSSSLIERIPRKEGRCRINVVLQDLIFHILKKERPHEDHFERAANRHMLPTATTADVGLGFAGNEIETYDSFFDADYLVEEPEMCDWFSDVLVLTKKIRKLENTNNKVCLFLVTLARHAEEYVEYWSNSFGEELKANLQDAEQIEADLVLVLESVLTHCIDQINIPSSKAINEFMTASIGIVDSFKACARRMTLLLGRLISSQSFAKQRMIGHLLHKVELDCNFLDKARKKASQMHSVTDEKASIKTQGRRQAELIHPIQLDQLKAKDSASASGSSSAQGRINQNIMFKEIGNSEVGANPLSKRQNKPDYDNFLRISWRYAQELPDEIRASNLKVLLLDKSSVSQDFLNRSISGLLSLQVLSLADTNIEYVPDSIQQLKHLVVLNLAKSKIRDIPHSLGKLKELKVLDLTDCKKLIRLPKNAFLGLKNLQVLKLGFHAEWKQEREEEQGEGRGRGERDGGEEEATFFSKKFSNADADQFTSLLELTCFTFSSKSTVLPRNIQNMGELTILHMACAVSDIEALKGLYKLEDLQVLDSGLTRCPDWICELSSLRRLTLQTRNKLASYFPPLDSLHKLRSLEIDGWESLPSFPKSTTCAHKFLCLEELFISNCNSLEGPINGFDRLRRIRLQNCTKLSLKNCGYFPNLESLFVSNCDIKNLPEGCALPQVQSILLFNRSQETEIPMSWTERGNLCNLQEILIRCARLRLPEITHEGALPKISILWIEIADARTDALQFKDSKKIPRSLWQFLHCLPQLNSFSWKIHGGRFKTSSSTEMITSRNWQTSNSPTSHINLNNEISSNSNRSSPTLNINVNDEISSNPNSSRNSETSTPSSSRNSQCALLPTSAPSTRNKFGSRIPSRIFSLRKQLLLRIKTE